MNTDVGRSGATMSFSVSLSSGWRQYAWWWSLGQPEPRGPPSSPQKIPLTPLTQYPYTPGDLQSQMILGRAYMFGTRGVQQDAAMAEEYFNKVEG